MDAKESHFLCESHQFQPEQKSFYSIIVSEQNLNTETLVGIKIMQFSGLVLLEYNITVSVRNVSE